MLEKLKHYVFTWVCTTACSVFLLTVLFGMVNFAVWLTQDDPPGFPWPLWRFFAVYAALVWGFLVLLAATLAAEE